MSTKPTTNEMADDTDLGSSHPDAEIRDGAIRLLDLTCNVSVIVGTGTITVRDCLALEPGLVLSLDQSAGDDLRVLANGVLVAAGEVSLDEEALRIRVTRVAPVVAEG